MNRKPAPTSRSSPPPGERRSVFGGRSESVRRAGSPACYWPGASAPLVIRKGWRGALPPRPPTGPRSRQELQGPVAVAGGATALAVVATPAVSAVPMGRSNPNRTWPFRSSTATHGGTLGLPARDRWFGSDPKRVGGRGCANPPAPEPVAGPRTAGSLPPRPERPARHPPGGPRSRKTLGGGGFRRATAAHRRTAKVRIGPPCRLRTRVQSWDAGQSQVAHHLEADARTVDLHRGADDLADVAPGGIVRPFR